MKKSPLTMGGDFFMPLGNKTDWMHIILYITKEQVNERKTIKTREK